MRATRKFTIVTKVTMLTVTLVVSAIVVITALCLADMRSEMVRVANS